jgi:hypothetical protein
MASEQEHHPLPHPALPLSRDPGCPRVRSFLWAVLFLRRVVVTSWRVRSHCGESRPCTTSWMPLGYDKTASPVPRSPATVVLTDEPLNFGGGKLSMRLTDHGEDHAGPGRYGGQHAGRSHASSHCATFGHLRQRAGEPSPTHSQARCLSPRRDIAVQQGLQGGTRG